METHFFIGKLTISMAIFNSYVTNYRRVWKVIIQISHLLLMFVGILLARNLTRSCRLEVVSEFEV